MTAERAGFQPLTPLLHPCVRHRLYTAAEKAWAPHADGVLTDGKRDKGVPSVQLTAWFRHLTLAARSSFLPQECRAVIHTSSGSPGFSGPTAESLVLGSVGSWRERDVEGATTG